MKIVVIGPGAMGCLFAGYLQAAGFEASLLDYKSDRAVLIHRQGLIITGVRGDHEVHVPTGINVVDLADADLVLVCVKAYATAAVADEIAGVQPGPRWVLTLQNGVGNVEILSEKLGAERVIGGVTTAGAFVHSPGAVQHAGEGDTIIGRAAGDNAELGPVVEALTRAGFKPDVKPDVQNLIWSKLVVNVGINALGAITRLRNGALIEHQGTAAIMAGAVGEVVAVAEARGIELLHPDPLEAVRTVCRNTSGNTCSMLGDVLAQRRTEIDFINGAVVREGSALGIETPVNRVLTDLVQTIEQSYQVRVTR
ncbi:MAG: 2-dehydropantoate 2-reductase [Proteobacteria bacterium]|nr:2-dehydropantoate 2-reductase [Pseudomonadota bacterium]MBU1741291.1 2-dehydropantoate 2-reductase [Pseudomonadota bacterium]